MMEHNPTASILIVDDEPGLRLALRAHFLRQSWQVELAGGLTEALAALKRRPFDLVLCDVRMGDGDGFSVMQAVRSCAPDTAFLFLTAFGSVPEAVRAMQGGAIDYLTKPVSFDHLLNTAARILRSRLKTTSVSRLPLFSGGMVGRSRALQTAITRAQAAAESHADVLIEAESGTGKELLARMIHDNSARATKPFIAVNCAALPEALLESELFGHARGAFTGALTAKAGKFELAHGGTLLLDEIGDMPLALQPKLLRVLQERTVERLGETRPVCTDIRVVASTNVDLSGRVDRGLFRSDLFYRLNVIPLTLPPLRERREDLPLLAQHFADTFATKTGRRPVCLQPSFLQCLEEHHWPGNIRELANFMQRVLALSVETELTALHFAREHRPAPVPAHIHRADLTSATAQTAKGLSLEQMERTHLERTLASVGGNRTRAAEMLGISVRTVRNKIRQYDLPARSYA